MTCRALALLLLCTGCASSGPDPRQETLLSLATVTVQSEMDAFVAASSTLAQATAALCASPSADALADARDAWSDTRVPWKHLELLKFGPVVEYPLRLGPKLDDWPVAPDAVEELVASDAPLDPAAFDAMGTATRGLPVAEYLLWGELESMEDRRCEVLVGASQDVASNATRLGDAWRDEWAQRIGAPSGEAPWETPQDAMNEWVNRLGFTVENLRGQRLGKPLGDDAGGEPQPDQLESRPSARSLLDARDVLDGVHRVWADTPAGIGGLLVDQALAGSVEAAFEAAQDALVAIPEPMEDSLTSARPDIEAAQESLLALQVLLQVDVAQALGVTIAFNDNDGD